MDQKTSQTKWPNPKYNWDLLIWVFVWGQKWLQPELTPWWRNLTDPPFSANSGDFWQHQADNLIAFDNELIDRPNQQTAIWIFHYLIYRKSISQCVKINVQQNKTNENSNFRQFDSYLFFIFCQFADSFIFQFKPTGAHLTHWGPVMHMCIGNLSHHWFRWWLVTRSAPSHYLKQCWNIVNWTLGNIFQWNFNTIFIEENYFENVIWNMAAILSLPQSVNHPLDNEQHMPLIRPQ